jgi:hypothetical protein
MIQKSLLQEVINKYYLGGLIESVKWDITDVELNISFSPPTKDMIGKLKHSQFPLENNIICIANTTQLNKLLNIMDKEILIETPTPNSIFISDSKFNIEYALANPLIIPKSGEINEPSKYEVEIPLSNDDIENLIKAKNALQDEDNLNIISKNQNILDISFGSDTSFSNKIKLSFNVVHSLPTKTKIPFNSGTIKEILVANKNPLSCVMYINMKGLMKLKFTHENMDVEYYIIRKSNI